MSLTVWCALQVARTVCWLDAFHQALERRRIVRDYEAGAAARRRAAWNGVATWEQP